MIETLLIVTCILSYAFVVYLKLRELRKLSKKPSETYLKLASIEQIEKTKEYNRDKQIMSIFELSVMLVKDIYFIWNKVIPEMYNMYMIDKWYWDISFVIGYMYVQKMFEVPFELVSTFYIEAKHGFNKTTVVEFFKDIVKTMMVMSVIIGPFSYVVLTIIRRYYERSFYIYLWVAVAVFQIVLVVVYPIVIQPLFNKFEEMKDSELKTKITKLADRVGFRANKILVMDASLRSGHSNAYFVGIMKEKRVVIYDTLLTQVDEEEILAILCHEFGHWKHGHTLKMISFGLLVQLLYLYLLNVLLRYQDKHGMVGVEMPLIIRCLYFLTCISAMSVPIDILGNCVSRYFERQADRFAVALGYGKELRSGLLKLYEKNNGNMDPDHLYAAVVYRHPTVIERIRLIDGEMNKSK
ncbi:peptidase M48 domain-containing protein [Ordospora colligata]|uniref:CAAX prenyl protease n=1 Tax=Ordospora colligata OC4 TaxID=1354746 RepID=A0A0B2UGX2_9MICR|nr:peptidase M48 domain-containing protein [Ordospora colligata OC4]KHN70296.1 peptidase M48 domain-containing protein [Ordospora colligata OC4]TBU16840.1 peptidase M48 domain-containing protein [Ordospora colligata]TBU16948.1 peptidase M48 domain-containing protein [Ordospora colligata]TBU19389.1 peptidase M48 domain-containing protein [Ordospora colligata]